MVQRKKKCDTRENYCTHVPIIRFVYRFVIFWLYSSYVQECGVILPLYCFVCLHLILIMTTFRRHCKVYNGILPRFINKNIKGGQTHNIHDERLSKYWIGLCRLNQVVHNSTHTSVPYSFSFDSSTTERLSLTTLGNMLWFLIPPVSTNPWAHPRFWYVNSTFAFYG